MIRLRTILALAALAASGAVLGQAKAPPVALKGHDPVSYFTAERPVKGTSSLNYDFDDSRYLFSTPKNKALFAANPDRYAPQFTGLCTMGLASGMKVEADPSNYLVRDGKLYVFSSAESRDIAARDPAVIRKAHEAWKGK
jgi:YHS domain-containing protein